MTTVKQALIKVGKNTNRTFHIGANFDNDLGHMDIVSSEDGFAVSIERGDIEKSRRFNNFADLLLFIGAENLLKKRCFLRFF